MVTNGKLFSCRSAAGLEIIVLPLMFVRQCGRLEMQKNIVFIEVSVPDECILWRENCLWLGDCLPGGDVDKHGSISEVIDRNALQEAGLLLSFRPTIYLFRKLLTFISILIMKSEREFQCCEYEI